MGIPRVDPAYLPCHPDNFPDMAPTCWDSMCGPDCAYCRYKQARYRQGFSTPCYDWFRQSRIEKSCRTCRFYLEQRAQNPLLPEDPAWHPS